MKEIKFRAWNILTKTMIDLKKVTRFALNIDTDGLFIPFSGMPVMQFTGLQDSEGKDIYEGDVVEKESEFGPIRRKVIWYQETCQFQLQSINTNRCFTLCPEVLEQIKIIGNIYENSEILEEL